LARAGDARRPLVLPVLAWIGTWLATLPAEFRPLLVSAREGGRVAGLAVAIANTVRQRLRTKVPGLHLTSTGDPREDCIGHR